MRYTNDVRDITQGNMLKWENVEYYSCRKVTIGQYSNAVVVPSENNGGGGLYHQGKYIEWSNFNGSMEHAYDGECENRDEDVLYIGMIFGVWGHCITDFLSHAWPLLSHKYAKVVYTTVTPSNKIPDNYHALIQALGIPKDAIERITRPTRFRTVFFGAPTVLSFAASANISGAVYQYTKEYDDTISRIIEYYNNNEQECGNLGEKVKRIYLSRGSWKKGVVDFGEYLLEEAFQKHYGCKVLRPETLSLGEMIRAIQNCDTLVATEGSVAHNSVFLKKGSKLIVLRKGDYVNPYQTMINEVRDLDVTYIDANYTYVYPFGDEPWFGPFMLAVNGRLAKFLGCKHTPFHKLVKPFSLFTFRYVIMRSHKRLSRCKAWILKQIGR